MTTNFTLKRLFTFVMTLALLSISVDTMAQALIGYRNSNYAGVSGAYLQPASTADGRFLVDVNLIGASFAFGNNNIGIKGSAFKNVFDSVNSPFADEDFLDKYIVERNDDRTKSAYFQADVYFPSFVFSVTEKDAVGFTWRLRNTFHVDGVSPELASLLNDKIEQEDLLDITLDEEKLSVQTMSWNEYAINYSRVVADNGTNFFKVGGNLKLIQGIQAGYFYVDRAQYEFSSKDSLFVLQTDMAYGYSDNFDINSDQIKLKFASRPTVGLDIGAVWEYRPDSEGFKYEKTEDNFVYRKDKNKYKFRLGVSILDIGRIKYKTGSASRTISSNTTSFWEFDSIDVASFNGFDSLVIDQFNIVPDSGRDFNMSLPTALSIQLDYQIHNDFYINFTPYIALKRRNNQNAVHGQTVFSLTPRWDHKWFGAFIPLTYNDMNAFNFGLNLRLGPVILGAGNLKPLFRTGVTYTSSFYALLKVPVPYGKPKDKNRSKIDREF